MGRGVDHGKREWAERIRRRQASGLTVAEFCKRTVNRRPGFSRL